MFSTNSSVSLDSTEDEKTLTNEILTNDVSIEQNSNESILNSIFEKPKSVFINYPITSTLKDSQERYKSKIAKLN